MTAEEYLEMESKALSQLRTGKSMLGSGGAFAPLLKQFLESALEAEMEEHLDAEERSKSNKRNGKGKKTLKTSVGEVEIETPQDRHSSFEPEIVRKRERVLADNLTPKILALYGKGMSLGDISETIDEIYDVSISKSVLSDITERIVPELKAWQSRPLEAVYPVVFMDAMHFKVRNDGKVGSKAIYTILAINKDGKKDLLGLYLSESEGANFWLSVLTDLQNRGLEDILIACIDNLTGFSQAIESIFPNTEVQSCVIHQIRNSLKYVASKDQKEFMKDLKLVYKADTKELAELNLDKLEEKWGEKYPIVIKSWRNNWHKLSTYFKYTEHIRKLIYTTNMVEGFHRQVRKVTKTKGAFTSDMALLKLIYIATMQIMKKWTMPRQEWGLTVQQLAIHFGEPTLWGRLLKS